MNLKRFTARTSRDALALVRQAFGDDAVVMSTRPCAEGVEVLAMAPESILQLERIGAEAAAARPAPLRRGWRRARSTAPKFARSRALTRGRSPVPKASWPRAPKLAASRPWSRRPKAAAWPKTWRRCR